MEKNDTRMYALNDDTLISKIGAFVRHHRLEQNVSQQTLADKAGIHRSTLVELENGKRCQLLTLIQVLRVLNRLDVFETFTIDRQPSPMAIAKLEQEQRKRASQPKPDVSKEEDTW